MVDVYLTATATATGSAVHLLLYFLIGSALHLKIAYAGGWSKCVENLAHFTKLLVHPTLPPEE